MQRMAFVITYIRRCIGAANTKEPHMHLVRVPSRDETYVNPDLVANVYGHGGQVDIVTATTTVSVKASDADPEVLALFDSFTDYIATLLELGGSTEWSTLLADKRRAARAAKADAEILARVQREKDAARLAEEAARDAESEAYLDAPDDAPDAPDDAPDAPIATASIANGTVQII